ncbi:MAG TPA: transporter substrate-binding protein, partial [Rhizomicrobium sp.]|nr:transporter substrate-binding protein [Rhizomicrobium sp.]
TTDPAAVRRALAGRSIRAPSGFDVRFDAETQHLYKPAIIGRFGDKNLIDPVWISNDVLAPEPWSRWLKRSKAA